MLSSPAPRPLYRWLFGLSMGGAAAVAAPPELLDVLRLASARPGNAGTVTALMHALNGFRRPLPSTVMTEAELSRVAARVLFCWGTGDSYLPPERARLSASAIPGARFIEVSGGHGLWLDNPAQCARAITGHLTAGTSLPRIVEPSEAGSG
jgi:pimeloyl-ACP methyl ester carboxylesterase